MGKKVSFGVISDVHFKTYKSAEHYKLGLALNKLYSMGEHLDALLIAGDFTDAGQAEQYDRFNEAYKEFGRDDVKRLWVIGNHDYWNGLSPVESQKRFCEKLNRPIKFHEVINGIHFIGVNTEAEPCHGYFSEEQLVWLRENIESAKSEGGDNPIFVVVHQHVKNTVYGSDHWANEALNEVLKDYPGVIIFSGHSHYSLRDERSIHQRDFTSVGTGTLSYMELEGGKYQGAVPSGAGYICEGLYVEVDEHNTVNIKSVDFFDNKVLREWIVEEPWNKEKFKYTDDRVKYREKPYFEEGCKCYFTDIKENSAIVGFDAAKHNDMVHSYKVRIIEKHSGKVQKEFLAFSEFYLIPMPKKLSFNVDDLNSNTDYKLEVYAIESFGLESEPLIGEFKTI